MLSSDGRFFDSCPSRSGKGVEEVEGAKMMPSLPIDGLCPFHAEPVDSTDGTCRVCRMKNVVSLDDKRAGRMPHLSGEARCMLCGKEWVAVAPVGTPWLECPECHSEKGYMKFQVQRTGSEWICNCGNDLFRVTPDGYYCPNCGEWQKGNIK